jgi:glutamate 5-kinase
VPHSGKPKNLANHIARCRRIVIKLGTNVIMRDDGRIALGRFYGIAESVAKLRNDGREVLLVSSGAIGLGIDRLGLKKRPAELSAVQACAAIGQSRLMSIYDDAFEKLGCRIAQVLLTEDDFRDDQRFTNLRGTLTSLLQLGVIPIINENDTVSTVELDRPSDTADRKRVFGDNDKLSGLVMTHIDANLLVLLSDIDGLFDGDPRSPGSKLITEVHEVTPEIRSYAQGKNGRGRGGMTTKLEAARIVSEAGRFAVIANGHTPHVLERVCNGELVGTWFWPRRSS